MPDCGAVAVLQQLAAHRAFVKTLGGEPVDGTSDSILAGLSTAGLLSAGDDLERRGIPAFGPIWDS